MRLRTTYKTLLSFGIFCSIFFGCREIVDRAYSIKTRYINQTQYTVTLEKYFTSDRQTKRDVYTLSPTEVLDFNLVIDGGCYVNGVPYSHPRSESCQLNDSDSVIVTFDNSKKLVFRPNGSALKDIYEIENFEFFKDNNMSVYTFNITETHYLQAK